MYFFILATRGQKVGDPILDERLEREIRLDEGVCRGGMSERSAKG